MVQLETVQTILAYNDAGNDQVLRAAGALSDAQLDRPIEMGVGSLRRTLIHIYNGEHVWLNRWQGRSETKWPSESEPLSVPALAAMFAAHRLLRDAYLATLHPADLAQAVIYRDSKGSLFSASRGDMLMQACVHSIHHRAQAANMLRQAGAGLVDLDYMMSLRRPA